jgi:hypothetical protein
MTNDEVRQLLVEKGITISTVTAAQLETLHDMLDEKLKASGCFRDTYKMNPKHKTIDMRYMTCSSDYFDDREAVSFNSDGFIGFAGWSSETNVKPILETVVEWAERVMAGILIKNGTYQAKEDCSIVGLFSMTDLRKGQMVTVTDGDHDNTVFIECGTLLTVECERAKDFSNFEVVD